MRCTVLLLVAQSSMVCGIVVPTAGMYAGASSGSSTNVAHSCGRACMALYAIRPLMARSPSALMKVDAAEEEISDTETFARWFGLQATVDLSIVALFAVHMSSKWGSEMTPMELWSRAVAEPELKFLIIMPAWTLCTQVLRRFGSEELPNQKQAFENDPIVKYLGGASKVRGLRDRMQEAMTVRSAP
mmetsp:Transcript_51492/g.115666  ORF Transcript_51492/g.115666 Transcript_51492/m.115666 type:complete len:187 (-) Transcript_51492:310-870(-)